MEFILIDFSDELSRILALSAAGVTIGILTWIGAVMQRRTKQISRAVNHTADGEPPLVERVKSMDDRLNHLEDQLDNRLNRLENRLDLLLKRQLEDRGH